MLHEYHIFQTISHSSSFFIFFIVGPATFRSDIRYKWKKNEPRSKHCLQPWERTLSMWQLCCTCTFLNMKLKNATYSPLRLICVFFSRHYTIFVAYPCCLARWFLTARQPGDQRQNFLMDLGERRQGNAHTFAQTEPHENHTSPTRKWIGSSQTKSHLFQALNYNNYKNNK